MIHNQSWSADHQEANIHNKKTGPVGFWNSLLQLNLFFPPNEDDAFVIW